MKRSKKIHEQAALVASAWEENAPDEQFAEMTLTQFRNTTKGSSDTRDSLVATHAQMRAKREERAAADVNSRNVVQSVVSAVRADPKHGPDSPLLAAMGYVTRSARKTGKTNKSNGNGNGNGVVTEATVAVK